MSSDAIRKLCTEVEDERLVPLFDRLAIAARAELAALEATLENREDILRAFAITAKKEDTAFARQVVAVVEAALSPPINPNAGLRCKDVHPTGCPFVDLPEDHTIGDHPNMRPSGKVLATKEFIDGQHAIGFRDAFVLIKERGQVVVDRKIVSYLYEYLDAWQKGKSHFPDVMEMASVIRSLAALL